MCPSFHSTFKISVYKILSDLIFPWNNYPFNKVFIGGGMVH